MGSYRMSRPSGRMSSGRPLEEHFATRTDWLRWNGPLMSWQRYADWVFSHVDDVKRVSVTSDWMMYNVHVVIYTRATLTPAKIGQVRAALASESPATTITHVYIREPNS
jgi:hypothetical protein